MEYYDFGDTPIMTGHTGTDFINYKEFVSQNQVDDFKNKVDTFNRVFDALLSYRENLTDPDLAMELSKLLQAGQSIKTTIIDTMAKLDSAKQWIAEQTGLNGLAFVPLVIWGVSATVVSLAVAAIVKWLSDAYTFTQKINMTQDLIAKGVNPNDAANIVNKSETSSVFSLANLFSSDAIKYVAIAGLAILFFSKGQKD